jgi:hypothetical protein
MFLFGLMQPTYTATIYFFALPINNIPTLKQKQKGGCEYECEWFIHMVILPCLWVVMER